MPDGLTARCRSIDVTPRHPVQLSGYSHRRKPTATVHDQLEINLILLSHADVSLLLLSGDFLVIGEELTAVVARAAKLPRSAILVGASHTHCAPATDRALPRLGAVDETYLSELKLKTEHAVRDLVAQPGRQVTMHYASGRANHAVNRRRFALGLRRRPFPHPRFGYYMLPNPGGAKDETIHVLRLVDAETTETVCVLWSYACHPVGFPKRDEISADYPGVVRQRIREHLGDAVPVVFLQGFGGNVRPRAYERGSGVRSRIMNALYGRRFGQFTWDEWRAWVDGLSHLVVSCLARQPDDPIGPALAASDVRISWEELQHPSLDRPGLHLQCLRLGEALELVGMSAEPMVEMVDWLRREEQGRTVIPVGYTDHTFGYLPTEEIWRQGGYEARDFRWAFSFEGDFRPGFQDVVQQRLRAILSP